MTPKKILISLAGLFGCGLVALLTAVVVPSTAAAQSTTPVRFFNSEPYLAVEFALVPENCNGRPAQRYDGVQYLAREASRTYNLSTNCDWRGYVVHCNAYIEFRANHGDRDMHPPGGQNHVDDTGRFVLTKGNPLRWNGHVTRSVYIYKNIFGNVGCNRYFDARSTISIPKGPELTNARGEHLYTGLTVPVTYTGTGSEYCQVFIDRVPQASDTVLYRIGPDGGLGPSQVSLVHVPFQDNSRRCYYTVEFPPAIGGMTLQPGETTHHIGGTVNLQAHYELNSAGPSPKPSLALATASDTGYSNSDGITNNPAPTIVASNLVEGSWVMVQGKFTDYDGSYITIEKALRATGTSANVEFRNDSREDRCRVTERSRIHIVRRDDGASWDCALNQQAGLNNGIWTFTATQYVRGNLATAADPLEVTLDETPPRTNAVWSSASSIGAGFSVPLTFNFSEPVYDFTASDLEVTGGTVSEPISRAEDGGPSSTYNATLTANADATGSVTVRLPINRVRNVASVLNFVNNFTLRIGVHAQSAKPTAALRVGHDTGASSSDNLLAGNTPVITAGNLVEGATVTVRAEHLQADGSRAVYRRTFRATGTTGDASFGNLNLGGGCIMDTVFPNGSRRPGVSRDTCPLREAAGQNSTEWEVVVTQTEPDKEPSHSDALTITLDNVNPRVEQFTADPTSLDAGGASELTLKFSEAMTGLEAADLAVTGGTVSALAVDPTDDTRYTATLTAAQDVTEATVSLNANAATDMAGNSLDLGGNGSVTVSVTPAEAPEPADPEPDSSGDPDPGNISPVPDSEDDPLAPPDTGSNLTPSGPLPPPVASLDQAFGGASNFTSNNAPLFNLDNLQVGAEVVATLRYDVPNSPTGDFTQFSKTFIATDSSMSINFITPAVGGECTILTSLLGWVVAVEGKSQDCIMLRAEQGIWTLRVLQKHPDGSEEAQAAPLAITFSLDGSPPAPEPPADPETAGDPDPSDDPDSSGDPEPASGPDSSGDPAPAPAPEPPADDNDEDGDGGPDQSPEPDSEPAGDPDPSGDPAPAPNPESGS